MNISCLKVDVYRCPVGDCTNDGISSFFSELLVYCPFGPLSFDPAVESPLNFCAVFSHYGVAYVCPAVAAEDGTVLPRPGWWMYGGNIAETSDSRFREMTGVFYPLRIHDRRE